MGESQSQGAHPHASEVAGAGKVMTVVRLATRADEADLMRLCKELHADNGIFEMDDSMVREMLDRAFNRNGGIIGVIDGKSEIAGAIYMLISSFWYSRDNHLEELFNFIRAPYRKSDYALSLVEFAKKCSDEIKIPLVIGVLTSKRMEAKVRLYHKSLGNPAGAFFVYGKETETAPDLYLWRGHTRDRERKVRNGNDRLPPATVTTSAVPMMPVVALTN
jgi:hypothetical protein